MHCLFKSVKHFSCLQKMKAAGGIILLFENYDTHQMREPWGYSDGLVHYALLCAQRQVFAEVVIISFPFSLLRRVTRGSEKEMLSLWILRLIRH